MLMLEPYHQLTVQILGGNIGNNNLGPGDDPESIYGYQIIDNILQ